MRISLTSPHTKGSHVLALQKALKSNGYLQGKVDNEFGPDTARAVYRAKYWLGYRKPDQVAGDMLYRLLTKRSPLSLAQKARVKRRRIALGKESIGQKMWKEAGKYIGIKEFPPNSNRVMFSRWYGIIGAWCAMFVSFLGAKFSKAFRRGVHYSYVPYVLADARAGKNHLAITYGPVEGDLALFDWDNDGIPDHIGLFGKWLDLMHGKFAGREGNTGHTNFSNGGEVMDTVRNKSDVIAFVHVGG